MKVQHRTGQDGLCLGDLITLVIDGFGKVLALAMPKK